MSKPIPVICINCKKESNRTLTNIKTRLLKYEEVNDVYTKNGMKLLWNKKEFSEKFTGSEQKIPVICVCNEHKEL